MQKSNQFSIKILGIDFGLRKVGFAVSTGRLADPLAVFRYSSEGELIEKIKGIVNEEKIEKVVIGISEGEMGGRARKFGERIKDIVQVDFQDETLTTYDAISYSIKAGIKKGKRKKMEDAYAAAIMLQEYLDR